MAGRFLAISARANGPGKPGRPPALEKRRAFLDAYAKTASIKNSCKAARIDPMRHYGWLKDVPEYAAEFQAIQPIADDALEDQAVERAMKRSDALLMFLLRGRKPEKYGIRGQVEVSGTISMEIVERLQAGRARVAAAKAGADD